MSDFATNLLGRQYIYNEKMYEIVAVRGEVGLALWIVDNDGKILKIGSNDGVLVAGPPKIRGAKPKIKKSK